MEKRHKIVTGPCSRGSDRVEGTRKREVKQDGTGKGKNIRGGSMRGSCMAEKAKDPGGLSCWSEKNREDQQWLQGRPTVSYAR